MLIFIRFRMEAEAIARFERLEADMVVLKQSQFEHECQIEALAFEVHSLGEKIDGLDGKLGGLVTKEEFFLTKDEFYKQFNHIFKRLETQESYLLRIMQALNI